jgi:hypothetical protein
VGATTSWQTLLEHSNDTEVNHFPVAATVASASKAAQAAGVKNVCTAVFFSVNALAAQGAIAITLRDGATGVGTILKRWWVQAGAGTTYERTYTGLWIPGSAATAMTLETCDATGAVLAPAATNFANVGLTVTQA